MVAINFRLMSGWTKNEIFGILKDLGYKNKGVKKREIQVENEFVPVDEFIREKQKGRNHLYVHFGHKTSGTIAAPQLKIYAHYDIFIRRKGKIRHIPARNEARDIDEMYRIHKALKKAGLGHMEHKDKNCWHATTKMELRKEIKKNLKASKYEKYEPGKFRKRINSHQYVVVLIYQRKYIHLICVYAFINEMNEHILNKEKARKELTRLLNSIRK